MADANRFDSSTKLPPHAMLAKLAATMPGDVSVLRTTSTALPVSAQSDAKAVSREDMTLRRPSVRSRLRLVLVLAVPRISPTCCPTTVKRWMAARPTPPVTRTGQLVSALAFTSCPRCMTC